MMILGGTLFTMESITMDIGLEMFRNCLFLKMKDFIILQLCADSADTGLKSCQTCHHLPSVTLCHQMLTEKYCHST